VGKKSEELSVEIHWNLSFGNSLEPQFEHQWLNEIQPSFGDRLGFLHAMNVAWSEV
jgi:hypothetical protein